jgi:50S ribosomal protein L16 3-hydroxylase
MEEALLGGLSPKEFLRRHWQKRPLLVRRALPDFRGVIEKRALFGLAARNDVEARLVERRGSRWRVTPGPLHLGKHRAGPRPGSQSGARRSSHNWTLLVNGVNHHRPAAEALLRRFSFLPQARLDDVMVSYAVPGGGVGPHFDSYDVFLVQGAGRRRWRIARPRPFRLVPGAPLKLIRDFRADEEMLLEPGDLLYLPPGWGHDGIALDECFTCSVGFRAPRGAELAASFLDYLHEHGLPDGEYRDPGLRPAAESARISEALLSFARRQVGKIRWTRRQVADFTGRYLSAPKDHLVFRKRKRPPGALRTLTAVLDPRTQLLYAGPRFFINGESFEPRPSQRAALKRLADQRQAPGAALARCGLEPLISGWREAGYLHLGRDL